MQTATLQVQKPHLLQIFNDADDNGKNVLKAVFGKEAFVLDVTDQVKTFEDACKVLGLQVGEPLDTSHLTPDQKSVVAYEKLTIINKALNGGWVPDWNDEEQYKYYPWFYMGSGGAGFRLHDCVCGCDCSLVGSRLCFHSSELAEYAGRQFVDLYKEFML